MDLIQWNPNGFFSNIAEIQLLLQDFNPFALLIQETNLRTTDTVKIKGYNCYRKDYTEGGRACDGVLTLIRSNLPQSEIRVVSNLQVITNQIFLPSRTPLTICNIYIPPNQNINQNDIRNLINQLTPPFILGGDLNAHGASWGNSYDNQKGKIIQTILEENNNLGMLNDGTHTHINISNGNSSAIDLTIASSNILPVTSWRVTDDPFHSHHFPIITTLTNETETNPTNTKLKWNFERADWQSYNDHITLAIENIQTITEKCPFSEIILRAANNFIPNSKQTNSKKRQVPWWSAEIQQAIKLRKKAYRKFKTTKTLENFIYFKKCRALSRRTILEAKKDSWIKFISQLTSQSTIRQVWNTYNRITGKYNSPKITYLKINNSICNSTAEITEKFANKYKQFSSNSNYNDQFLQHKYEQEQTELNFDPNATEPYNQPFTLSEFLDVVKQLKPTSPGSDEIYSQFIQNLNPKNLEYLLEYFNEIWQNDAFPVHWTEATIIPILKPHKDPKDINSYRPISLTSIVCKLFERLVNNRLKWLLETRKLLNRCQNGFRSNRSTMDSLTTIVTDIENALINKHFVLAVFFDLQKAFDTTWRHEILKQIHQWNLKGHLPKFIKNFLEKRTFRVKINNNHSTVGEFENGTPQGSVISPTLFLIAINNLANLIPPPLRHSLYADDLVVYIVTDNLTFGMEQMQSLLNNLNDWTNENGLKFSTEKTVGMIYSRYKKIVPTRNLKLYGQNIKMVQSFKYLGMVLDEKLNWKRHINEIKTKCQQRINVLKSVSHQSWGADRKTLTNLYKASILSILDYGCHLYSSASATELKKLNALHNQCLRIITGAYRTSPVESLYVETGEPSLYHRRQYFSIKNSIKTLAYNTNPNYGIIKYPLYKQLYEKRKSYPKPFFLSKHMTQNQNLISKIMTCDLSVVLPPWNQNKNNFIDDLTNLPKNNTLPVTYKAILSEIMSSFNPHQILYTDGSKEENNVGCAVVTSNTTIGRYKLPVIYSIFSAELHAILEAVRYINQEDQPSEYLICTDSRSAFDSIKNYSKHPIVTKIRGIIDELQRNGHQIFFCWIPSHIGIVGNERADNEAKNTVTDTNTIDLYIPPSDITNYINQQLKDEWEHRWQQSTNKLRAIKPAITRWKTSYNDHRKIETALTRLRIGHSKVTHQHIFEKLPPPNCELCDTPLTIAHIIIACPRYQPVRQAHDIKNSLKDVLGDHPTNIKNLINFIKITGIINNL